MLQICGNDVRTYTIRKYVFRAELSLSLRNFRKAENPTLPKNIRESFREIMDVEICMSPMDARVKLDVLCTFNLRPVFKGSV